MTIETNKIMLTDRILDAAETLFRKFTFNGVNMAKLSTFVGVSRKTLYNHFPGGKREIWRSCVENRVNEYTERVLEIVGEPEGSFIDRADELLKTGREAMDLFYGSNGLITSAEDERIFFPELRTRYVDLLSAFLKEGIRDGNVRSDLPVRTVASVLVLLINQWDQVVRQSVNAGCSNLTEFVEQVLLFGIIENNGTSPAELKENR